MAWRNRFKQRKACKKNLSKELMSVAWYPTRSQKMRKKEVNPFLIRYIFKFL